jgi:hypothetical protein
MDLMGRFIEKLHEEHPGIADGIFRELKQELEALAE